ncbi:hypothetical protein D1007_26904 [Hordeum vulgare]|nr:hypothetical protein D1007_26904 [Hordeum vulgare]
MPVAQFRPVSSSSHPRTPFETPPTTSPPPPTMANFELDPEFFLPPGHNFIDGGPDRLPRTYTTRVVPITWRHERFVIADIHPAPPVDNLVQVRQEVAALLLHRGLHVRSAQPWIEGVGLFELRDAAESYAAVQMVPQEVAHNSVPPAAADGGGWEPEAAQEAPPADPVQDQESMVIDQPSPSSSDSVHELVDLDPQL